MLRIQQINQFRHLCKRPFSVSLKHAKKLEVAPQLMPNNTEKDYVVNVFSFEKTTNRKYRQFLSEEEDELYRGIDILLTAHSPQILDSFGKFIELVVEEFGEMGVEFDGYTVPRVHKDKWLTNKAPFKYGRHKVEYEVRTYKKVCHLLYLTGSTRKVMLNYIQRNIPAGVGMEVKSFKLAKFPTEIEEQVENNFFNLTDSDQEKNKEKLDLDSNEMRKLQSDAFEARRRPWNLSEKDKEKEEIMAFRRQWRQPMTVGRI